MRTCTECGVEKPEDEFYWRSPKDKGRRRDCKACNNARHSKWKKDHPEVNREHQRRYYESDIGRERRKAYSREYYQRLRKAAIEHYGASCACCGESQLMFLALDHINNDGADQRRADGLTNTNDFLLWLKRNNYPDTVQTLCHNCNFGKHLNGGVCPHDDRLAG